MDFLSEWLKSLTEPEKTWKGAYTDEVQAKAFHNVRNFLRSLSEVVRKSEDLPKKDGVQKIIHGAIDNLKPY